MLPIAVCVLAVAVLLAAEYLGARRTQVLAKLTASTAFVWAAVAWGAIQTPFGQLLLAGLILCWIGDALLLSLGQTLWFKLGIGAFLLAHLSYALACTHFSLDPLVLAASGAVAAFSAGLSYRWLYPSLPGGFRVPVIVYIGAISLMVALACTAVRGGAPAVLAIGAIGFAVSDLSVARDRFIRAGFINTSWGLPAYFLSQLALAWAAGQPLHAA